MPRLFISHSSKDNVEALAFRRWLAANGWAESEVFIDLHGIGAGARWRETLRKANTACEAVVLLASPNSLSSVECEKELELAEALGKPIIPAILRDLTVKDPRLVRYADRQLVDLSQEPTERIESFEHEGKLHRVEFSIAALASIKGRLADLGIAPGSFAWEPHKLPDGKDAGPYPGLAAFREFDAGIFFGREADIVAGLAKLRLMRKRRLPRLLVIQAASGAGKSSFLKAGLWPRLKRDPDFAPLCILRPAQGILTGPDGIGHRIAPWFERQRRMKVPGDIEASLTQPDRAAAVLALMELLAEATALATTARRAGVVDARTPAPLLAIDQGEELFASENVAESERFLDLLASVFNDLPEDVDPYVLITIRADSMEPLLQRWPALGLAAPEAQVLPPLSPTAYRDVITKPAEVYTERVRRLVVEPALADKLSLDATGGDALPLLAFTLEKLFEKFGVDGNLTLQRYESIKGFGGAIDTALGEAMRQAGAAGTPDNLRRLFVPGLATWDPAANAAKRLVAAEADLLGGKRSELIPLANALVANRLLTRGAGSLEVAHEALLRRPPLDGWLEKQKDALKLRDDVLREAKEWADAGKPGHDLPRRGARLESALALQKHGDFDSALAPAKDYLAACRRLENAGRRKAHWAQAAIFTLMLAVIGGLLARMYERELRSFAYWHVIMGPRVLTSAQEKEKAATPGAEFAECASACPTMVVVPPGKFMMGSPASGKDRDEKKVEILIFLVLEGPQHEVTIANPFAVGRTEVTFAEWNACVAAGACSKASDNGWGRDDQPVINVNWDDAKQYVAWLARITGKKYRLLSEAEWEYAARAGSSGRFGRLNMLQQEVAHTEGKQQVQDGGYLTASGEYIPFSESIPGSQERYSFTDDEAQLDKQAWYRGNSDGKTHPVGKKAANAFGLYDMHGNVFELVEDPWHENYEGGAPTDGSAWKKDGNKSLRVVRGGSWGFIPLYLRAAHRDRLSRDFRYNYVGFRLARTLNP